MNKLALPSMITQLSNIAERKEKLVEIVLDLLKDDQRKVLVLSERREQLKTLMRLFDSVNQPAGLYIGGMKDNELKLAESKRIMLSTYAMTSEGFDNPHLNTLVFATPKTNIEQSVGRILRKIHNIQPVIIDVIDNYSLFKVQGYQRKYFYKNKQYTIHMDKKENQTDTCNKPVSLKEYAFDDS